MSDRVTSHGTVKGHHPKPEDNVTEGGKAPSPTEGGHGSPKPSASKAAVEGVPDDDTSSATAGTLEKQHAAQVGAEKAAGRGHHKE